LYITSLNRTCPEAGPEEMEENRKPAAAMAMRERTRTLLLILLNPEPKSGDSIQDIKMILVRGGKSTVDTDRIGNGNGYGYGYEEGNGERGGRQ
jgi:hypothetical protein